jgi:ABC-type multidrug transport system fused ATPase/permease subunit
MFKIFRKIGKILTRDEKRRLAWLMGLDIISSIADILSLALLLFIIHFYTENAWTGRLSFLPAWMTAPHSLWLIGIFFLFFSIKNGLSFLIYTAQSRFRYGVASRISQNNLLRYLEGSFGEYAHTDSSVHVLKIAQQPIEFCQYVLAGLQQGLTEWTLIIVTVIAVLLFNAKLFLLLLVLLLPPVVIVSWLTKRRLHSARMYIKTSRDIMWQHLQESIASFVESNLYDKTKFFTGRYGNAQRLLNRHLSSLQSMQGAPSRLAEVFAVFGLLALIAIGHYSGNTHSTEFVTLGAFLAAAYKIIPGIARVLNIAGQMRTYEFTMDALLENRRPREPYSESSSSQEPSLSALSPSSSAPSPFPPSSSVPSSSGQPGPTFVPHLHSLSGNLIGFCYDKTRVLEDCSFQLQAGDFLGIRGDSGKGKTTLLNVILGFIEATEGDIFFNGVVVTSSDRKKYWRRIAYVKQQPFIIHDSLLANITLGEEMPEEERLRFAIRLSGLDDLIKRLPKGIDSTISESGKNVSGGQRQRIALARALYKDADLVILDEPFSELDEASEERLLDRFRELAGEGKMIIMITHNKKSLAWCNRTLSLEPAAVEGNG